MKKYLQQFLEMCTYLIKIHHETDYLRQLLKQDT